MLEGSVDRHSIFGHADIVPTAAFSPNGRWVISGSHDKTIKLWNLETGLEVRTLTGHTKRVRTVLFSPDSSQALSVDWGGTVKLWDVKTGRERLSFSYDGRQNVSNNENADEDERGGALRVVVQDPETGEEIIAIPARTFGVGAENLAISPDGRFALIVNSESINLWNLKSAKMVRRFTGHTGTVQSIAFSPEA